jgi:ABC-type multidrug transport system fused ATPase/permease subunit
MAKSRGAETGLSVGEIGRRLGGFAKPHWRMIVLALAMMLGKTAMTLAKPWPVKLALDHIVLTEGTLEGPVLKLLIGVMVGVVVIVALRGLFAYWEVLAINRAGRTIIFSIRKALFDQIQRLSLQFHSRRRTGDLMTRVTSDVKALRVLFTTSLLAIVSSVVLLVGIAGVLLWMDWRLALIPIIGAPLMVPLIRHYSRDITELSREERHSEGALASVLSESLGSVRLTRVFNRQEHARTAFLRDAAASLESGLAATMAEQRVAWWIDGIWAFVTASVLGLGVFRVVTGSATAGELVVFVHYVKNYYKPLRAILKHVYRISKSIPRAERILEVLETRRGVQERPDAVAAPVIGRAIEFRNVSFTYEGDRTVLDGVELEIPAGSVTAIVGPTGAGKSTVVSLIPRLYDPTAGEVRIDGRDIRDFTIASLRAQIGVVLQESILLRTSIAENIAYGRSSATVDEIHDAAKAAHAHEFIVQLPDGYDTVVGERGDTLSGGQRQRIAIARAMVGGSPILLLDEPLAGLDPESAGIVVQALDELMKDKTVVIITHQLATIRNADQIIVMDGGRAVQMGRYDDLLRAQGKFRELCDRQEGGLLAART